MSERPPDDPAAPSQPLDLQAPPAQGLVFIICTLAVLVPLMAAMVALHLHGLHHFLYQHHFFGIIPERKAP